MRIAYLAPFDLTQAAGHTAHVVGTIRELVKRGEEVTLYAMGCPKDIAARVRFRAVRLVDRRGLTSVAFGVVVAALLARELASLDVVYSRYFKSVALPLAVARARGCPMIVEVNAGLDNERRAGGTGKLTLLLERSEERVVVRLASAIVVVTGAIKRELTLRHDPRIPVTVVENGVDTQLYRPLARDVCRRELGLRLNSKYVVFTGALQPWQGVDDLLNAFAAARLEVAELELLIVGDGPGRLAAQELAERLGIERHVSITGFVTESQVGQYLGAADVCVAPYNTQAVDDDERDKQRYGASMPRSPLKIFSYMACGRPIIATHFAEAGAYLALHEMGVAVPPEDARALATALVELLANPAKAEKMGARARAVAEAKHGWEIAVGRYLDVARAAVAQERGG